jgi:phosphopantetheinyl transferase
MYDRFNFKLPDFQFALLRSDAFDHAAVEIYPEEIELLNTRSNPKRKNEFLGVRYLRNQLKIKSPILYQPSGRPYFSTVNLALSISHSKDFIALASSAVSIGIDIEEKDRDAARIINKFASEDEKVLCTDNPKEWYLQLWCAKEAIYKLAGRENLSFKNEISILSRQNEEDCVYLNALVNPGEQQLEIEVRLYQTAELHIAIANFKVAP